MLQRFPAAIGEFDSLTHQFERACCFPTRSNSYTEGLSVTRGPSVASSSIARRECSSSFRLSAAADGAAGAFSLSMSSGLFFMLRWALTSSSLRICVRCSEQACRPVADRTLISALKRQPGAPGRGRRARHSRRGPQAADRSENSSLRQGSHLCSCNGCLALLTTAHPSSLKEPGKSL